LPSPADVPLAPIEEAEPASPEPAAEPPVPTELPEVPPPADEPPVPSVEDEPEPEPAEEPPVPTVLLEVPPPADEPPVPTVDALPDGQLVAPAVQSPPAELPPVPTVLLEVPPPADEPPVPSVLDDWANAVLARRAAAKAMPVALNMGTFLHRILSYGPVDTTSGLSDERRLMQAVPDHGLQSQLCRTLVRSRQVRKGVMRVWLRFVDWPIVVAIVCGPYRSGSNCLSGASKRGREHSEHPASLLPRIACLR
jgi:hypothetical protein